MDARTGAVTKQHQHVNGARSEESRTVQSMLLDPVTWEPVLPRLFEYARWKLVRLHLVSTAVSPEDFVMEAIKKVLAGERNYDTERFPDLLLYMKSVIDSLVSHQVQSAEQRKLQPMYSDSTDIESLYNLKLASSSNESAQRAEYLVQLLRSDIENDVELTRLLDEIVNGNSKPIKLATLLGVNQARIYVLMRKLKRRASRVWRC